MEVVKGETGRVFGKDGMKFLTVKALGDGTTPLYN